MGVRYNIFWRHSNYANESFSTKFIVPSWRFPKAYFLSIYSSGMPKAFSVKKESFQNWGAQSKRKVNIVVIEKWNIKTVRAKGRQNFFSGKAKQNKVGAKAGQEKKRKEEKKEKERKNKKICLAFAPTLFCFALPLKKFYFPFTLTVFMFHFSVTTIFTFLLIWAPHLWKLRLYSSNFEP